MKARITNPNDLNMSANQQRNRGLEIMNDLRSQGFSDDDICRKMGIPITMKERFFNHIGFEASTDTKS